MVNIDLLFNKEVPKQLDIVFEIVDVLKENLASVNMPCKYSTSKNFSEYGIYIKSMNKEYTLFVGIWYDLWETKIYPLCITIEGKTKNNSYLSEIFEKSILNGESSINIFEYNDYVTIAFEKSWFSNKNLHDTLFEIINKIQSKLNFGFLLKHI